jgi:ornithine carbamoyltransferase
MARPRHFIDMEEMDAVTLRRILDGAHLLKKARSSEAKGVRDNGRPLAGKVLAMIFERPSTRTRVSFDVAMRQLGGECIVLNREELQLGRGETIADTARVLSRYVDAIMVRMASQKKMGELAQYATVPVINGLTDESHPCQVMADVMTFEERQGPIKGRTIAWSGDGNNMCQSWIHAAVHFDFRLRLACPDQYRPSTGVLDWARARGGRVELMRDPTEAVRGADCIATDCWISMGAEAGDRHNVLKPYQVNRHLMALADKQAIFLHCLPAHRGEEVTDEVIDGPQSAVFDEAENRLHAQKAILSWCFAE